MKLDSKLTLQQLVSCDVCYVIFSPDNISQGVQAKKHICPRCEDKQDEVENLHKKLEKKLDKLYENIKSGVLIEVTKMFDQRVK